MALMQDDPFGRIYLQKSAVGHAPFRRCRRKPAGQFKDLAVVLGQVPIDDGFMVSYPVPQGADRRERAGKILAPETFPVRPGADAVPRGPPERHKFLAEHRCPETEGERGHNPSGDRFLLLLPKPLLAQRFEAQRSLRVSSKLCVGGLALSSQSSARSGQYGSRWGSHPRTG
jgi:hypothetical protein